MRGAMVLAISLLGTALGGCAAAEGPAEAPPPAARPESVAISASFAAWRNGFRSQALAAGISPTTFDRAFQGVGVSAEVLERDAFQPEFTRPIWEYLDRAVSDSRIENGRAALAAEGTTLAEIERRFGVDAAVVTAIWGIESAYGAQRGSLDVIESLATLAHQGRRRSFGEEQLVAALQILEAGDVAPRSMVGSWAGAMGHTQFIPTSYLAYAADFDGDGRRNIWGADPSDALASTANYLSRFGWTPGAPWGVEVRLPAGFDFSTVDQGNRQPVSVWQGRGVTRVDGSPIPDHGPAALLAPAGAGGPVFAVYNNFRVIKRYNNATSYALAVGHLADRLRGAGPFAADWPRGSRALSRAENIELQERLTALGYDTQGADGIIGPNTIAAIRAYQRANGLVPDGFPTADLLQRLATQG
ncbi:MAG: lytic murein transglycosylase [Pseudomonadota bacterium]